MTTLNVFTSGDSPKISNLIRNRPEELLPAILHQHQSRSIEYYCEGYSGSKMSDGLVKKWYSILLNLFKEAELSPKKLREQGRAAWPQIGDVVNKEHSQECRDSIRRSFGTIRTGIESRNVIPESYTVGLRIKPIDGIIVTGRYEEIVPRPPYPHLLKNHKIKEMYTRTKVSKSKIKSKSKSKGEIPNRKTTLVEKFNFNVADYWLEAKTKYQKEGEAILMEKIDQKAKEKVAKKIEALLETIK